MFVFLWHENNFEMNPIISLILMLIWRNFCAATLERCGASQRLHSLSSERITNIHHHKRVCGLQSSRFSWCLSACPLWTAHADALIIPLTFYRLVHIFHARV